MSGSGATRTIGAGGPAVSALGLGCNNFGGRLDEADSLAVIDAALDHGITFFDTADIYADGESERLLGVALVRRGLRDAVVIATKGGLPMPGAADEPRSSRGYLHRAVRASLRRLGTDRIDLYQLHAPDGVTPVEETVAALDELVTQGLVRHTGVSNLTGWQLAEFTWAGRLARARPMVSVQYQYHLLHRTPERELLPLCARYGLGTLPFFPLANGLLTGKYRPEAPPPPGSRLGNDVVRDAWVRTGPAVERVEALRQIADAAGRSLGELAIGWLLAQPTVASVIAGASTPAQVAANAAAAAAVPLTDDELAAIDEITAGAEMPSPGLPSSPR